MFEKFVNDDASTQNKNEEKKDFMNIDNLKDTIYKTFSKSIDRSKELKNNEKNKMEKIMNLLIYLQMKKVEMKLNYFNDFEKLIQFETQQMKSMESQIIQDRIKLAIKKSELISQNDKIKSAIKKENENAYVSVNANVNMNVNGNISLEEVENGTGTHLNLTFKSKLDNETRILDLNH